MADKPWRSLPQYWPEDGETVWVRIPNRHHAPFQARFSHAAQTFLPGGMSALFTEPVSLPWWMVLEWREL
jgi:hypothetical protein